jgi:hypothetical protein
VPASGQRPPADEVTVGEVNRNVMDLRQVMTDFITEVRGGYVRQDVYKAEKAASGAYVETQVNRIDKLERENDTRQSEAAANRRLAISAVIAPLLVGIIVALFTIKFGA